MGCTSSKPVATEPMKNNMNGNGKSSYSTSNKAPVEEENLLQKPPRMTRLPSNKNLNINSKATKQTNGVRRSEDAQWTALWKSHHTLLLDPADVHSTIEDLMAIAINKLSPSEITFIQRKVRKVIRNSNFQETKKSKRLVKSSSTNNLDQNARDVAERHHLLTKQVIQQVLPSVNPIEGSSVNPIEAIFSLLFFTHESLWDRVADAAVQSAKEAGFNMDVNALQPPTIVPPIYKPKPNQPPEVAPGVSLKSLTFLMGLALRKYF